MARVQGTYASVVKGVSQQTPSARLEGQHGEVLNMLSDPVRGLVRRNGMILDAEQVTPISVDPGEALADSFSFRVYTHREGDTSYDIKHRTRPRVGPQTDAHLNLLHCYNKTAKAFIPVSVAPDAITAVYEAQGISAMTSIGAYVLFASNGVAPSYGQEAGIDNLGWKNTASIWVRGGDYAKKYTVKATRASDGFTAYVEYTTPVAQYPGVLDLTLRPPFDAAIGTPYEQYFQNILRAIYDTQVNQWIASSSAAIIPSAIATELANRLSAAGIPGWTVVGSHLLHDDVSYVEVTDGGNGTMIRAVLQDAKLPSDLTDIHRVGKVVRIRPTGSTQDVYYLKAYPAADGDNSPYQTVIWREAAGLVQRPAHVLAFGRVVNGTLYWASGPAALKTHVQAQTGVVLDVPEYAESAAGDLETNKPPRFFGKRITMLAVFQDRLLVGSGSTVNASRIGDYLNFYRTTILTKPADDAVEMFALGTEDDTIRTHVLYDRTMLLVGDKFVYSINGRAALTADAPNMAVQFEVDGLSDAKPVGVGKNVFMLKLDNQLAASALHQVQAGSYQDSPDIDSVSKQLRDYVNGTPAEMVGIASPGCVVMRTEHFLKSAGGFPKARPWGLYLYQFLDDDQGRRLTDAWSAIEWSRALGTPIGISGAETGDAVLLYTVAFGTNPAGQAARSINVQHMSVRPDPTGLPYLDGMRPAAAAETTGLLTPVAQASVLSSVYTSPGAAHSYSPAPALTDSSRWAGLEHPDYTIGDGPPEDLDPDRWTGTQGWLTQYKALFPTAFDDNLWTGTYFPAYVDLTNPFVRDREDKALTDGDLTLTKLHVTTTRTAGITATVRDTDGTKTVLDTAEGYRRIHYAHLVWVGKDTKRVQVRVQAKDWLPLTIDSITWQGNWFASRARV